MTPKTTFIAQDTEHNGYRLKAGRYWFATGGGAQLPDDGLVDAAAVGRVLAGDAAGVRLTPREVICVVWDAAQAGLSDARIAALFDRDGDTGLAWANGIRRRHGIPTSTPAGGAAGPGTRDVSALDCMPRRVEGGFRRWAMSQPFPLVYSPTFGTGDTRHRRRRSMVAAGRTA